VLGAKRGGGGGLCLWVTRNQNGGGIRVKKEERKPKRTQIRGWVIRYKEDVRKKLRASERARGGKEEINKKLDFNEWKREGGVDGECPKTSSRRDEQY